MKKINLFLMELLSAIYPNKCISCGEIIDSKEYLCDNCNSKIERINLNEICTDCGLEKSSCVCKYNIYRFNSLVTVFINTGLARKTYYSYKFNKKQNRVKFFGREMAMAVKKCYPDVQFDFVCSVPNYKEKSFDHSGLLAKEISKIINVQYNNSILVCNKKTKKQHKSTFKERLTNVDNKYFYRHRLQNSTVLLVDDIKTTGATLDECAKVLLFAGAESVYCVTTLGTTNNFRR